MGGHGSYVRRLDRHDPGNDERCGRQKSLHVISHCSGIHSLPDVVDTVAQAYCRRADVIDALSQLPPQR
jgi:hypothetical protein